MKRVADEKFELVDTETRETVRETLRKYWEGFENMKARARDKDGRHVVYKLKDWPPSEEFGDALPNQYRDLMSCIPMPDYTTDSGARNLVGRLPRSFGLVPDLGRKLYTAYGLASDERGTTNLHLDMSDAVNVLVYVGTFKSRPEEVEHQKNVLKALEEAGIEKKQMDRLTKKKEKVGALWHIYDARDADKIRDVLNCHALEHGRKLHKHHDPIHDQSFYLDAKLRKLLKDRHNVVGYTIVQFVGDAVFIPAGAPHQVRNLSSCIKVAEDFVSPENVAHCFNLTEEFRQLSPAHENHEDKLQIKNIIYHAIKDSLAAFADITG
jgi:lysine-specific demethylase 3